MSDRIKTAVVGVGQLGQHHLSWLAKLDQSELVGLYDTDRARAGEMAAKHGVKSFDSLEELADKAEMVSIVVPTSFHHPVATELIGHSIHCLIEKPVTTTVAEAKEIEALADKHKVKISVGQIERFNPAVRAVVELGVKPRFVEAHRMAAFNPRGTDVPVALDLMIHDIDLVLMLTGSKTVDIQASAVAVVSEQADIANARLTMANGAVANLTASRISLGAMRKIRLFQKSGYYSLDLAKKQADLYSLQDANSSSGGFSLPIGDTGQSLNHQTISDDKQDMLGMELADFIGAIIGGTKVAVPIAEATEALRVALEVEQKGFESLKRMMEV